MTSTVGPTQRRARRDPAPTRPEETPTEETPCVLEEWRARLMVGPTELSSGELIECVDRAIATITSLQRETRGLRTALRLERPSTRPRDDHGRPSLRRRHRVRGPGEDVEGHQRSAQGRSPGAGLPGCARSPGHSRWAGVNTANAVVATTVSETPPGASSRKSPPGKRRPSTRLETDSAAVRLDREAGGRPMFRVSGLYSQSRTLGRGHPSRSHLGPDDAAGAGSTHRGDAASTRATYSRIWETAPYAPRPSA